MGFNSGFKGLTKIWISVMIKLKAWGWPVWTKHVAWYNYKTSKGVLTEWFYTKLSQHIGMNNYKLRIECCYTHIGQVFLSFESSFSIEVKCLPLQLCGQCVPLFGMADILIFSILAWQKSVAPTECLRSYSFGKRDQYGTMFSSNQTNTAAQMF